MDERGVTWLVLILLVMILVLSLYGAYQELSGGSGEAYAHLETGGINPVQSERLQQLLGWLMMAAMSVPMTITAVLVELDRMRRY